MRVRESQKYPFKTAREVRVGVLGENEDRPSVDTIKRRLRETGLHSRVSRKKLLLSERNRKKRLGVCPKVWPLDCCQAVEKCFVL